MEKRPKSKATFVGAILRKELESLTWEPQGEHFVVYSCPMLQPSLAGINQLAQREQKRGKVFGVPPSMVDGYDWLDHQPTSESGFLEAVCAKPILPWQRPATSSWPRRFNSESRC